MANDQSISKMDWTVGFADSCIRKISELIPDTCIVEPTQFTTGVFDKAGDGLIICPSPIGQNLSRIVIQTDPGKNYNFDKAKEYLVALKKIEQLILVCMFQMQKNHFRALEDFL